MQTKGNELKQQGLHLQNKDLFQFSQFIVVLVEIF